MDQQFDFRALLVKLQDCLSDNDRRRLHFIVGDTIPRHLRDDPTLGGTLNLLESLFDRAKISEQDFDYLIHAFEEIHCYDGVKKLQEYKRVKQGSTRHESIISEIIEDNNENGEHMNKDFSTFSSTNNSKPHESNLSIPIKSLKSEKNIVNIFLTFIKQIFQSRLTICQLILLILNICGILTIVIIAIILRKQSCSTDIENILMIREGNLYGETSGGDFFNDAIANSLTLNDRLVSINATWSFDTLTSITFIYSNGGKSQHGTGDAIRRPIYSSVFNILNQESFNGVIIYRDLRDIINPYKPNGTIIIVGLQFFTNKGRQSELLGSTNGNISNELLSNYTLMYVRGRSYAFIDALQFIWLKEYKQKQTLLIENP